MSSIIVCHDCGLGLADAGLPFVFQGDDPLCNGCAEWRRAHPPEPKPSPAPKRTHDHSAAHTALVRHCVIALRRLGCMATKNLSGWATLDSGQRTLVGLGVGSADIVGIMPGGRALACECKTGRGELSAEQARFLRAVNAIGGFGFVARSVEDVRRAVVGSTLTVDAPGRGQ